MNHAVIFLNQDSLNFMSIRNNVIRIPEVYNQIQKAQKISDELGSNSYFNGIDFSLSFLQDDHLFKSNLKLKNVLMTLVQIGLYERHIKKHGKPSYIVGDVVGETTVNVLAAQKNFKSLFIIDENPGELKLVSEEPILSGATMGLNQIFSMEEDEAKAIFETKQSIEFLVQHLFEEKGVKLFVNIGPGLTSESKSETDLSAFDLQLCESIDIDPMLNWFWPAVKAV